MLYFGFNPPYYSYLFILIRWVEQSSSYSYSFRKNHIPEDVEGPLEDFGGFDGCEMPVTSSTYFPVG